MKKFVFLFAKFVSNNFATMHTQQREEKRNNIMMDVKDQSFDSGTGNSKQTQDDYHTTC